MNWRPCRFQLRRLCGHCLAWSAPRPAAVNSRPPARRSIAAMSEPTSLPPYAARELVSQRLPLIFPEGTPHRNYCIRDVAAYTVFTMLYIGAVEGSGRFLGPKHVYRMTGQQAAKADSGAREKYGRDARAVRDRKST